VAAYRDLENNKESEKCRFIANSGSKNAHSGQFTTVLPIDAAIGCDIGL